MLSEGTVLKIEGDLATVGVKRHTACDSCRAQCGGHCDKASTVETVVKNTLGARVGDRVKLYSSTTKVMGFAMTVFIMPLILTALGFALPYLLGAGVTVSAVVAVLSFIFSYVAIWLLHRNTKSWETIKMQEIIND